MAAIDFKKFAEDFKYLNPKDPGTWPVLPKLVALLALLVAVLAGAFFAELEGTFGSKDYGREELVAEMAGAFICAALGIVPSVRHADYIGSWLQIIREDNRAILRAASAASKAADYILACRDTASTGLDVAGEDEADGFELEGRLAA